MAYTIRNADGTVLVNIVDGTIDTRTTSISLVGKNKEDYGTALNTNLVNILQNFASNNQPRSPLVGQLWYSRTDGRLKVFTVEGVFSNVSAALLSDTKPLILKQGDLWIDSANNQLYFTKDGTNTVLAGPIYSQNNGKSGFLSEYLIDDEGNSRPVTKMFSNGTMLGILSTCSFRVAPASALLQDNQGMFEIAPGLNLNNSIPDVKFVGLATTATNIGAGFTLTNIFLKLDNGNVNQSITGTGALILETDSGISLGTYTDATLYIEGGISARRTILRNNIADGRTELVSKTTLISPPDNEKTILTAYRDRVGINLGPSLPTHNFHVEGNSFFNGNATITGNLTVEGTQTVISTVILQVEDKNIELATSGTWYTDALIDGGGLTLHGTTDKTLTYYNSATAWTSNINYNIAGTGTYKINAVNVLSSSTLGTGVTQTSITRVGVLEELTVTNVLIKGSAISNTRAQYPITSMGSTTGSTTTGSSITVNVGRAIPFLSTGSTITVDGIAQTEFNQVYLVNTVTSVTASTTQFTVSAATNLTTSTATLGATPIVIVDDLMLHARTGGDIDVTGQRVKNLAYSLVPSDAATVQLVYDTQAINLLKGFSVTLDITYMTNPDVIEIPSILEKLLPPTNANIAPYSNESAYDLALGTRARVLCVTNQVTVRNLPINVVTTSTSVSDWPAGAPIDVLRYISVTSGVLTTATVSTYTVKEFRVTGTPKVWTWFRNIP
jgi:hypothetical protein